MNSEQLRIFINVADYGSFSKAENTGFISKQAMFKQIHNLEEEVGCPLFIRSRTGVVLSESGRVFYEGAKKMLQNQEDLITRCRQAGSREFIRVGSVEHQVILDPVNAAFAKKYPEIEIRRIVHPNHSGEYRVSNHIMDVGETFLSDHGEPAEYNFTELTEVPYYAAVSLSHPLAKLDRVSLGQLKQYQVIAAPMMLKQAYLQQLRDVFENASGKLIETDEVDRQVEIAFQTAACANVLITANPFIRSIPDLKLIPLAGGWKRTYGIIYLSPASETVRKYVQTAVETYQELNRSSQ